MLHRIAPMHDTGMQKPDSPCCRPRRKVTLSGGPTRGGAPALETPMPPTATAPRPRRRPKPRRRFHPEVLTDEEVKALMGALAGQECLVLRTRALLGLLYRGGLRISEALS